MLRFLKKFISDWKLADNKDAAQYKRPSKYYIYIYHPNTDGNRSARWRKVGTTHSIRRAVRHARLLHKKHKYQRIEVKKNYFRNGRNAPSCKTIRIYDGKRFYFLKRYIEAIEQRVFGLN